MLQLKNVSFFYNKGLADEVKALSNISLSVGKKEFISVVGPNGSGKSTLALLLNGLIRPHEGEVLVDGVSTTHDEEKHLSIKQKVGLLFQNPDNQIVATVVEEDIAFGPENLGIERKEIKKRIDESLIAVKMEGYRNYEPHQLSAGQKQKIALASLLAMKPDYLILDEPTAYLDPSSCKDVLNLFAEINCGGITVVNITHHPDEIFVSKKVIALDEGKIIFEGSAESFFQNEKVLEATGIEQPLWFRLKEKYSPFAKELAKANSTESTINVLCSLS